MPSGRQSPRTPLILLLTFNQTLTCIESSPASAQITQEENETNFNYNSLQAGLRIENRHGWTVQFAYTWSHELDEVSNDLNILTNPFNAHYDYGSGAFDRRNIFNASYIYNLPFFLHSSNTAERTILGGWVFSGITFAQSGLPQAINYTGPDSLGLGGNGATNREDQVANVTYPKKQIAWFSTSSFADPLLRGMVAPIKGSGTLENLRSSCPDSSTSTCRCSKTFRLLQTKPDQSLSCASNPTTRSTTHNSRASMPTRRMETSAR